MNNEYNVNNSTTVPKIRTNRRIKHVWCHPEVLAAVTDTSLVRVCQEQQTRVQIETPIDALPDPVAPIETSIDAAQLELCRRYEPLILKYAHRFRNPHQRADSESLLWLIFLQSIYAYDANGAVPFAGYVKSAIYYAYLNALKTQGRQYEREIALPSTTGDDDMVALDQFPSDSTVESLVMDSVTEQSIRTRLYKALSTLPPDYRRLLHRIYTCGDTLQVISRDMHVSRQAVQQKHQRALRRLAVAMGHVNTYTTRMPPIA